MNAEEIRKKIFNISSEYEFENLSLEVFRFQYQYNKVYRKWCELLDKRPENVKNILEIPFLPISFFKTHSVVSFDQKPIHYFKSSGTTSKDTSKHLIHDLSIYEQSFTKCFEQFFDSVKEYCFIALLPNYLSQGNSSLIYMMDNFISKSNFPQSRFFNDDLRLVRKILEECQSNNINTILFGVTYALLDLIDLGPLKLNNTIVFETGGMKGRRKEMIREELHHRLCQGFGIESIASEYGMCELFSQAYSKGNGLFFTPKHMKVLIRDTYDSLTIIGNNKSGGINVIDLANLYTCSFIATEDIGKQYDDESFEILGRIDNTITRGCNLMYDF